MNLHGVPRMTMDVDVILALDDANLDAFLDCARQLGLEPLAPVPLDSLKDENQRRMWIEEKHLIAFALAGPSGAPTVDLILKHGIDIDAALRRALVQDVQNVPVTIASIDDMITLKRDTGRRQDEDDVEHLLRIRRSEPT